MGNWKSRKAGTETGTGTENWKRSSGAVLVCMQYIAWLLLTPMILEVVTIKGWLSVSTIVGVSLELCMCYYFLGVKIESQFITFPRVVPYAP